MKTHNSSPYNPDLANIAFNRTNDVRKEKGVNTKILELIKVQTFI